MPRSIAQIAAQSRYKTKRYKQLKAESIERLSGKCAWCGSTKKLEFDHIDRSTRKHRFPYFVYLGKKRFEEELAKCQLLCQSCHVKKSLTERGRRYCKGVHGTQANYQKHGCRCDKCRKAHADMTKHYRNKSSRTAFV